MTNIFIVTIALGALSSTVFRGMMWYMRTLQMLIHLPMLQTALPANVSIFFNALIPAVTFDIIETEWSTELLLDFDWEKQREI